MTKKSLFSVKNAYKTGLFRHFFRQNNENLVFLHQKTGLKSMVLSRKAYLFNKNYC